MGRIALLGAGASAVALMPFVDSFTRADGDLGNGWDYTAGIWTISSGAAIATPGTTGANLFQNPGFDSDTKWYKDTDWSISGGVASKVAGAANREIYQNTGDVGALGHKWYEWGFTVDPITGGLIYAKTLHNFYPRFITTAGTYVMSGLNGYTLSGFEAAAATECSIDNVSLKRIPDANIFATRELGSPNFDISIPIVYGQNGPCGIVACLDNKDTPANYLLCFLNLLGGTVALFKVTSGTYTLMFNTATGVSYADGRVLQMVKSGNTVKVYYNAVQIGTNQDVTGLACVNNTRHGMFNSHPTNQLLSFTANP